MSVINILSPHLADMIAAGEVVERPASVVKELMENSIDAGARSITVEIRGGGNTLIRVSDDGKGMSPDDAGIAFQRHATSKISGARDLECISTLGFRGEALAAISAVSRIELLTRERGEAQGTRVTLDAGDIMEMGPAGSPEGTVMSVRSLFYNTPARRKFIRSDKTESSACAAMALRCALGHPELSVRFIRDGQELFFTPGDGRVESAVYTLLGRDVAMNMLDCFSENDGVRVSGCVTAPHACRGNRAMQFFFINGRAFRSTAIQTALEQGYKNALMPGRFPGCALYIELPHARVDVNVHPAKTEVKFSDERAVFDTVYWAVLSALSSQRSTAQLTLNPSGTKKTGPDSAQNRAVSEPRPDFYRTMSAGQFREMHGGTAAPPKSTGTRPVPPVTAPAPGSVTAPPSTAAAPGPVTAPASTAAAPVPPPPSETDAPSEAPNGTIPAVVPDFRVIGEAMNTYIIVESEGALALIDKHAAHERMIFDALRERPGEVMSQTLMMPVTFSPGAGDVELILDNLPLLEPAGFEIEPYGQDSVIIRAVPADTDGDERAFLEELCEKLRRGQSLDERRDAVLHSIACKAAIKAGWKTDDAERRVIAEKVLSGEVRYCPHGRPVCVRLTRRELDRQFKRIT